MSEPEFLDVEDVLLLHDRQLARFGGGRGLRDRGLLESAVAQPQASSGSEYVHEGLFAMAAAYLFHLVSNHPFVDGNKRTAHVCYRVFLAINDVELVASEEEKYVQMLALAEGSLSESAFAAWLRPRLDAEPGSVVHERRARYAK